MKEDKNIEDMTYEEKKDTVISFLREPTDEECDKTYNFFQHKLISLGSFLDDLQVNRVVTYFGDDNERMTFGIGIEKWSKCNQFSMEFWEKHLGRTSEYYTLFHLSTFWILILLSVLIKPRFYL